MERATILLVDDDPISMELLDGILGETYRCLKAMGGEEALGVVGGEELPDLVLLDVNLPDMDGFELCRRIKGDDRYAAVPIIFVTATGSAENEVHGFNLGAVDFLTKPFSAAVVRARVKTHLRLKAQTEMLERMAWLDGLTSLPNRRRFDAALELEGRRAYRERLPLAVLFIDVDSFKAYNDHYGHGAGDECLRKVADALQGAVCRPADLVARYGGEEFAVLMPNTDREGALEVAERMREGVERICIRHDFSGDHPMVTVSIGAVAAVPGGMEEVAALVDQADQALYQAKGEGKNRVCGAG
ncbi:diguanylate cyclase [Endothiovibrio diazotrophicus]